MGPDTRLTGLDITHFITVIGMRWTTLEYSNFYALKVSFFFHTIVTVSIDFATLTSLNARAWSRINHRGPLETLMRKITEGHRS